MSSLTDSKRPELLYPTEWEYRVIGSSEVDVRVAIGNVFGEREHSVAHAPHRSPEGRWISIHVQLVVHSEAERDQFHRDLVAQTAVRMVM